MNIVIMTDSRGYLPSIKEGWTYPIQKKYPNTVILGKKRKRLDTLYAMVKKISEMPEKKDIIILQCGHHDMVVSYPLKIWSHLVPGYKKKHLIRIDECFFQYRDMDLIINCFRKLKSMCDRVLLIGMHSWLFGANKKMLNSYYYHESILNMNDIYSRFAGIDYFHLPMHPSWTKSNSYDNIHYNSCGRSYISSFVRRYINQKLFTFKDVFIQNKDNKKICEIEGETKSISQIWGAAKSFSSGISKYTKEKDVVCIGISTSFNQLEAFLGSILANRIPVIIPLPSSKVKQEYFEQKMEKIAKTLCPSLCISDKKYSSYYDKHFKTICNIVPDQQYVLPNLNPSDTAFIQLSSGTTGIPKVIEITHKNAILSCLEYAQNLNIIDEDVIVSWLPLYHDMGLIACTILPIVKGIKFVHINPFTWLAKPELFFQKIEDHRGTHIWLPNFAFSYLSKRDTQRNLSSLKKVINCSEVCKYQDMMAFAKKHKRTLKKSSLCVSYALAENVFAATQSMGVETIRYNQEDIISCGQPICGTSIIVVNKGKDVSEIKEGELHIKSSYQPLFYKKSFFGYYPTGDYGFINNGNIYILGRIDDMIISYGKNIFPYEIERKISTLDDVKSGRVVVLGIYDQSSGTENIHICVEITANNKTIEDIEDIEEHIRETVSGMLDSAFRIHILKPGWLVKTSSGKLMRKECRKKIMKLLNN